MDFDEWIRAQLAGATESPAARSPWLRRPRAIGRMAPALQAFMAALAIAAIAVGLYSVAFSQPIPIHVLMPSSKSLPVNTWAGAPPPPAVPGATTAEAPSPTLPPVPSDVATTTPDSGGGRTVPPTPTPAADARGPSPPQTQPSAAPAPPSSNPPPSSTSTFRMRGGSVTATCGGADIVINSATPNPGFQVEQEATNGGRTISVRFRSDAFESEIEVWCSAGLVQSQIQEGTR